VSGIDHRVAQARELLLNGKVEQAIVALQRLLPKLPRDVEVLRLLSAASYRLGRFEQARYFAERALEVEPRDALALVNLALAQDALSLADAALRTLRDAAAWHPGDANVHVALANALLRAGAIREAADVCERGLRAGSDAQLAVTRCSALMQLGEASRAADAAQAALAAHPDEPTLAAQRALALQYSDDATPQDLLHAHAAFGGIVQRIMPAISRPPISAAGGPEKRLRVGIVSPDLRHHSVAFFLEPFLAHRDPRVLEIRAYSTSRIADATTARLRALCDGFVDASGMSELDLAQRVIHDQLDVAIDLAGHTQGGSLLAFGLRLAPVQITWLGYPDSTGLASIDARFVDSRTDPTPEIVKRESIDDGGVPFDARGPERLIRLDPCFLCYRPPTEAPEPAARDASAPVVFGSFNAARKLSPLCIELWSRVLRAAPESRLMLKSLEFRERDVNERVLSKFAEHGIDAVRLTLLPPTQGLVEHLSCYASVDIALDSFPYHGTTTTCEALWMGVPVITRVGNRHASRVGVSLLTCVGLPELVAHDDDAFVAAAHDLARNRRRLTELRLTLRHRLRASPLLDEPAYAQRVEEAIRRLWRQAEGRGSPST
jgi:predicted O-linked N-acetylglucosamine transferase (SPINDLY family)